MSLAGKRSFATFLAVGLLSFGVGADTAVHAAQASADAGALPVVRAYLTALDHRDARAVCATFAPQLRSFYRRSENSAAPKTCRGFVAQSLKIDDRPGWTGVRIVQVGETDLDPLRKIEAVHLILSDRYRCGEPGIRRTRCHPHVVRLSDIVYVAEQAGLWKIVKPGRSLRAALVEPGPGYEESLLYPPGDATTVLGPALIGTPQFTCPTAAATVGDLPNDVRSESYKAVSAPWLDFVRFGISSIDANSRCFSLELAAAPRADSEYVLAVADSRQPDPIEFLQLQIDGLGNPHVLLVGHDVAGVPSVARLVRFGLLGDTLQIALSKPLFPAALRAIVASVLSHSMQPEEPLIADRLSAEDEVPRPGCLSFPSGKLTFRGLCDYTGPAA